MKKNKKILVGLIAVLIIINSFVVVAKADNSNNITVDNLISSSGLVADNFDNQTIKTYISQFANNNPCLYNIDFSNNERVSSWLEYINSHELPVISEFSNDYYGAYIRYFDNQDRIDLMCFSSSQPVFYFAFINEGGKVCSLGDDLKGRNIHYIRSNGTWNVTIDNIGIENVFSERGDYYQNNYLTGVINLIGSSTIIYGQGFSNAIGATPLTLEGLSSILVNGGSEPFDYSYHKFKFDGSSLSDVDPLPPEEETFKNHMYFKNVVIGLEGGSEPLNSQIVIGAKVDDYLEKYSDNCSVLIQYSMVYNTGQFGNVSASDNAFHYNQVVPLNALLNGYLTECLTVFDKSIDMGYQPAYPSFRAFYNHLYNDFNSHYSFRTYKNSDVTTYPMFSFNSLYGFTLDKVEINDSQDNLVNLLPHVEDYYLEVRIKLICDYDNESAESNFYSVKINFLNGNTSIINADGLNNDNPWYDENVPEGSTINSNNGTSYGSGSNVAYGGQSNVNVNFQSYKGTSLSGVSPQDTEDLYNNHMAILDTLDTAKDLIEETRDENSSFMKFLSDCCAPFYNFTPIKLSITFMLLLGIIVFIFHLV